METLIPLNTAAPLDAMPASRVLGAYLAEARSECVRYLRAPGFMLPISLFPAMFIAVSFQLTLLGIRAPIRHLLGRKDTHR